VGAIFDIVASLTLRAAIVIAVLNMTIALQGKLSEKTAQANMFNLVTVVSRVMSYDFTMVGNQVSFNYFTYASPDTIEVCYVDPSTAIKTWVKYFAGPKSELSKTSNPRDRILYRAAGTAGAGLAAPVRETTGVDSLLFVYYKSDGTTTTDKTQIKSFRVYLVLATGDKVNSIYPAAEWTCRFFPMNIY
jgi:hypothetical protein